MKFQLLISLLISLHCILLRGQSNELYYHWEAQSDLKLVLHQSEVPCFTAISTINSTYTNFDVQRLGYATTGFSFWILYQSDVDAEALSFTNYYAGVVVEQSYVEVESYRVMNTAECVCPPSEYSYAEQIPFFTNESTWHSNIPVNEIRTYLLKVNVPTGVHFTRVHMRGTGYVNMLNCREIPESLANYTWQDNNTLFLFSDETGCESALDLCNSGVLNINLSSSLSSNPSILIEANLNGQSSLMADPLMTCPVALGNPNFEISSIELYGPLDECSSLCELVAPSHIIEDNEMVANSLNVVQGRYLIKLNFSGVNNFITYTDQYVECMSQVVVDYHFPQCNYQYPALNECEGCLPEFAPGPGEYVVSAWVKQEGAPLNTTTYTAPYVEVSTSGAPSNTISFTPQGEIIDGWQLIEGVVSVGEDAGAVQISLKSSSGNVLFDDVRFFPKDGSMKCYVYDPVNMRLVAELDERHFATLYEYDEEGALLRVKKETSRGIMTIQESRNSAVKK